MPDGVSQVMVEDSDAEIVRFPLPSGGVFEGRVLARGPCPFCGERYMLVTAARPEDALAMHSDPPCEMYTSKSGTDYMLEVQAFERKGSN